MYWTIDWMFCAFWLTWALREKKYDAENQTTHPKINAARTMTAMYAVVFNFFIVSQ
jgi:hypothetical protein